MTPHRNKLIAYGLSGLFALSVIFCVLSLAYSSFERISGQSLNEKFAELELKRGAAMALKKKHDDWQNISTRIIDFSKQYLMSMDDYSRFRRDLNTLLQKNRLQSQREFQPNYKRMLKKYFCVEVNFTASGTYPDLKRFIYDLSTQEKMVLLKRMTFNRKDLNQIIVKFVLEVYIAK